MELKEAFDIIDATLGMFRSIEEEVENGEAVYDFSYQTAVMVTEMKSPRGERATAEAIANGFLTEADLQKRSEKGSDLTIFEGNRQKNRQIFPSVH